MDLVLVSRLTKFLTTIKIQPTTGYKSIINNNRRTGEKEARCSKVVVCLVDYFTCHLFRICMFTRKRRSINLIQSSRSVSISFRNVERKQDECFHGCFSFPNKPVWHSQQLVSSRCQTTATPHSCFSLSSFASILSVCWAFIESASVAVVVVGKIVVFSAHLSRLSISGTKSTRKVRNE